MTEKRAATRAKRVTGPSDGRLGKILRLLSFFPTFPGVTWLDACKELDMPRATFFRLVRVLRDVGFRVESEYDVASGRKLYFLRNQPKEIMNKLFGL